MRGDRALLISAFGMLLYDKTEKLKMQAPEILLRED